MTTHHIQVVKTARYYTLGELNGNTQELWFVVHGFAQLAEAFLTGFKALDNGHRFIVAPEALNRFYLRAGKPEVGATWMTREEREKEIADYTDYLNALYDSLKIEGKVRIVVLGFSQGVATISRWAFKNPRKIDVLIFYAGEPGNELQESMAEFAGSRNYFIWGNQDPFINELNIQRFKDRMPNFEFISFEGKHEIDLKALPEI